ncbi:MAG: hypothetical protein BWY85_02408 [Firmicutes bacterium ADurb.Bin506]|nr:MAG: hypothetical protein BWY85_02408 [Firmicutes bacterium ADurb.Bin506]
MLTTGPSRLTLPAKPTVIGQVTRDTAVDEITAPATLWAAAHLNSLGTVTTVEKAA